MTPRPDTVSRRQALMTIAFAPLVLAALFEREPKAVIAEELLPQCAASLTACKKLLNSSEMLTVETVLPRYLPTLVFLAQQPSHYQVEAAGLAAQGFHIASILALHRKNITLMEAHRRKAMEYAVLTGDINQEGAAIQQLLGALYHRKREVEALELYSQVFPRMQEFTPLLQSAILLSGAWAFGQRGEASKIDRSIERAYEIFPTRYEDDPGFLYADFLPVHLSLYESFARLAIAQPADAWNALASVGGLELGTTTPPERLRLEVINYQAQAALGLGDLELCQACLLEGATGAKKLESQKRYAEAFTAYQQARVVWPGEKRVQELGDLFT